MIEIKNVSKTYNNDKKALNNISFKVNEGEIFGFIGHNGAGKTTMIKSIVGILDFEDGDILINNKSIKDDPIECKLEMAYVPDNPDLYENMTAIDFINFICDMYGDDLETRKGNAKAICYYAGHGIPDETSKSAYLLPVDGYGSDISTGYSLEKLYADLGNVPSQSVTVFLDACFSGAKREGDMLASARGVALKANRGIPVGNVVVFSAAQGDETAYPYKKEGHGLFTYYLLKELKDTKGDVTLKQLGNFVTEKVSQQSIVINSKPQTPTMIPAKTISSNWENWNLK